MGVKKTSKIFALLIAVVMIMTSGVGVFAADSPIKGKTVPAAAVNSAGEPAVANSTSSASAAWAAVPGAVGYNVYANGVLVAANVKSTTATFGLSKGYWNIEVEAIGASGQTSAKSVVGYVATALKVKKVTAKKAGSKKIKVSWKKVKGATGYRIHVYKNGAYWKTVTASKKATSKTIKKLSKNAKYKFVVEPVKNGYVGVADNSKSVKAK